MEEIKLWQIKNNDIVEILKKGLDFEARLEEWLKKDLSILLPDLFIIGSQVKTDYGDKYGLIDILAMNKLGELVIIELKKDKTQREIISQVLEYASWVKELDYEQIEDIIKQNKEHENKDLSQLYYEKFKKSSDNIEFNSSHRMIIVGSSIDNTTTRIIKYLSSNDYGVNINAVTFNYFKSDNNEEFLAKSFLIPEEEIELVNKKSKEKKSRSESTFKILINSGKLKMGDNVIFNPAKIQGINDDEIMAEIINNSQRCLKYKDGNTYSFSALRRKIVDDFKISDVYPDWGFNLFNEWYVGSNSLNDLLND
jgi:hypothetical protein